MDLHRGRGQIFASADKLLPGFIIEKAGKVTAEQVRKIAEQKQKDLNAYDLKQAEKIIRGTARSMGVDVEG